MNRWLMALVFLPALLASAPIASAATTNSADRKVYILPIREDIMPPLVYLVRRGVKDAMQAKADVLIIDMDTNGGKVSTTEEIIHILDQFKGQKITYVNKKAFSAGAFISFATDKIYMAPQSVIGAAAPIMLSPTGSGAEAIPETVEVKITSALSALVRANAEKNGHNPEVAEAMVKKDKELIIDGKTINAKGQILTLTDREAAREYGKPAKPLLSAGTIESIEGLLNELGLQKATLVRIEPTGAEKLGAWINTINPILLVIGIIAFYIEFKTPGFGIFGTIGLIAFAIFFLGGYIAGLSGAEWVIIFVVGIGLVVLEIFVFPGTIALGLIGAAMMLISLVMALVDVYPGAPIWPLNVRMKDSLEDSMQVFGTAAVISVVLGFILARFLPHTQMYGTLVSQGASGAQAEAELEGRRAAQLGAVGVAVSVLRPGGKAQFGDQVIDVMSQGDLIPKGKSVKIIGYSGPEAIVEVVA
jgi:membrane-bound serine protease (ClpP class)